MSQQDTSEKNGGQPVADDSDSAADNAEPQDTEVAAAEAPELPPETERAPGSSPRIRRRNGSYVTGVLALTCALFAAGAVGLLWWQYRQFYADVDQAYSATSVSLQTGRADVRALEDRMADLAAENLRTREFATDLGERVDAMLGRFLDLEDRLNATQGVSEDTRRRWLRIEAEYYLTVANAELTLAGRWDNATRALEFADEKLLELSNPALGSVRERIAAELMALRAIRLADVEGLSYSLTRLADGGRTLSIRSTSPGNFAAEREPPAETPSGLARIWLSLKGAVAAMVSIERRDEPIVRSLSTEEQTLVRQQLELELVVARLGLVSGQADVFRQSLMAAKELLARHFDTGDPAVASAMALLEEMAALDIAPARPDISGSLNLLRSLADRDN